MSELPVSAEVMLYQGIRDILRRLRFLTVKKAFQAYPASASSYLTHSNQRQHAHQAVQAFTFKRQACGSGSVPYPEAQKRP